MSMRAAMFGLFGLAAAAIAFTGIFDTRSDAANGDKLVDVIVPTLSEAGTAGAILFNANCAKCHGSNAAGVEGAGPPLVHVIYEPGHHGDMAFQLAARNGVRAHHWRFGNMPPVDGVTEAEVAQIVTYIRALQRANGID